MTLPTLSKVWQFKVNQLVTATGNSNTTASRLIRIIKNAMTTFTSNPWTVSGSSNAGGTALVPTGSAGLDAVDRWSADADVVNAGSGARHAWIILRQIAIATNYEICFDMNTGVASSMTLVISPSAGFTGGSATARPTATDEIVLISGSTWHDGADVQHQAHIWQSTDGQCTRVIAWNRGVNMGTFFLFDKPQNPVTGWTNPSINSAYGATPSGIAITYANLSASGLSQGRGSAAFTIKYSGEGDTAGLLANTTSIGTTSNEFDTTWPFYPIGIYSTTTSHKGRHGNIFDLWWRSSGTSDGDTFPNDCTTRQFIAMGPLILPWTGDNTIPLLV